MRIEAKTIDDAWEKLMLAKPELPAGATKVAVFVDIYASFPCPVCGAGMTRPMERCIDCENDHRQMEQRRMERKRRAASTMVEH